MVDFQVPSVEQIQAHYARLAGHTNAAVDVDELVQTFVRKRDLPGHPEAFAIGDMAYLEQGGQALPMLIPVAMQQARHVARAIDGMTRGRAPRPFHYADPGMMATIGRNAGIAQLGPVRIDGFPGWLLWLGFHLLQIITLRAKLVVLVNWTWDYFFLDRPIRLLVRASR